MGLEPRFRGWRILAVIAVFSLLSTSCGRAVSDLTLSSDQTLHVNVGHEPNFMDPGRQAWPFEALFGRNVFEALLKPGADLKDVQGAAASSFNVQTDGLTYVFHLRVNARWSDGQQVTAQDFVYGWKRILDPRIKAPYADPYFDATVAGAQNYSQIDPRNIAAVNAFLDGLGLSAPDDHTFVVKLQMPAGYFKWIAALWVAAPIRADIVKKFGSDTWAKVPSQIVGNGPFRVSEMVSKNHYILIPNDYYWAGKPRLSHLVVSFMDPSESFRQYLAGNLDVVGVPLANALLVQDDPKLGKQIQRFRSLNTNWLTMNSLKSPFDNAKVREAVARAIDRQKLIRYFGHGQFTAMQTLIPAGMNGYRPDLGAAQTFDPAAAREALQASGLSQSVLNDVHFSIPDTSYDRRARAQFIIGQIKANLGLQWTLEPVPVDTLIPREQAGQFQLIEAGWGADYPDDQDWMDPFQNGCQSGYPACPNDQQFNQLVSEGDQTTNQTERQTLYDRAQAIVINNYWFVFLYSNQNWVLIQPYVRGVKATALDEAYLPGDFFTSEIYITQH